MDRNTPTASPFERVAPAADERFYAKLGAFLEPGEAERAFLDRILQRRRSLTPNATLITEGDPQTSSYVLLDGWAIRQKTLADGRRQILNVVLPGDMIGLEAHVIAHVPATVNTLTACTFAEFKPAATMRMLAEQPRLAAALLWATAREEAFLGDHLLSVGRRPAIDRVAHFMIELYHRLRLIGMARTPSFEVPLNLSVLADAMGLSVVHVCRTFAQLRRLRLLEREGRTIHLLDLPALEQRVEYQGVYVSRSRSENERMLRPGFSPEDLASCF